jgi:hypothetical protein
MKSYTTSCFICGFPYSSSTGISSSSSSDGSFSSSENPFVSPRKSIDSSTNAASSISSISSNRYPLFPPSSSFGDNSRYQLQHQIPSQYRQQCLNEDVWLCLVCGFTGCGSCNENHIENHYQDTFHTYAMNIYQINKVWDFAGNGYVHRLILEKADDGEEGKSERSDNSKEAIDVEREGDEDDYAAIVANLTGVRPRRSITRTKVTEVMDVPSTSQPQQQQQQQQQQQLLLSSASCNDEMYSRSYYEQQQGFIDEESREAVVNNKLDKLMMQYQELLVWRLSQNRLFYEEKLKNIWSSVQNFHNSSTSTNQGKEGGLENEGKEWSSSSSSSSAKQHPQQQNYEISWMKNIKLSLLQEQNRLAKQCDMMKEKIQQLEREEGISKEFHRHLIMNKKEWEERVIKARERLELAEKTYK